MLSEFLLTAKSVSHIYIYIYIYIYMYVCMYVYPLFLSLFSHVSYYRVFRRAACAIQ